MARTLKPIEGLAILREMKYEILAIPGQGYGSEGMKHYLVIAKSKLGMNESSEVVNYALYRHCLPTVSLRKESRSGQAWENSIISANDEHD